MPPRLNHLETTLRLRPEGGSRLQSPLWSSWISDARAIENAPSLRRLDSGAVVDVDAILQALGLLDAVRLPVPNREALIAENGDEPKI